VIKDDPEEISIIIGKREKEKEIEKGKRKNS
jgi:hypothetical protein